MLCGNNEGVIPKIPGLDMLEYMRKTSMKDRYVTAGLINNTEDWYTVRHKVQQDMMRPKSALYYIDEIDDIAVELVEKIDTMKVNDGMLDPSAALYEYDLEAVDCVFIGVVDDSPSHPYLDCSLSSCLQAFNICNHGN